MQVIWVRGYYGSHVLKYIEWVEVCRFWKKEMALLQIFIDSDNWLTNNLIIIIIIIILLYILGDTLPL